MTEYLYKFFDQVSFIMNIQHWRWDFLDCTIILFACVLIHSFLPESCLLRERDTIRGIISWIQLRPQSYHFQGLVESVVDFLKVLSHPRMGAGGRNGAFWCNDCHHRTVVKAELQSKFEQNLGQLDSSCKAHSRYQTTPLRIFF